MSKGLLASIVLLAVSPATAGKVVRKETTLVVVHYSATSKGTAESIRRYHKQVRGWSDIGYHYVITRDGKVEPGRPENLVGAHAKTGGLNRNSMSVGVCLIGKDTFTQAQRESLVKLLAELCQKYRIEPLENHPRKGIQGHHKDCPGPGLDLSKIRGEVSKRLH